MLFTTWNEAGAATDVRPSRTVLVVDDDKETLDVLCQVLRRDAGACTYLRKPLDLQRVRHILGRMLDAGGLAPGPGGAGFTMTMSNMGVKRTSVFVRWSRWIVRRK